MSKFVLDGVTFDLNDASVSKVDGMWVVNTKGSEVPSTPKTSDEIKREKWREYQRRYLAKKKEKLQKLQNLEIPVFNSKYESSEVEKLQYGSVAKQVIDNFMQVNNVATVKAHSKRTIYAAFNKNGWGAQIMRQVDDNVWEVARSR